MAKRVNSFSAKGELVLEEGMIYEVKNPGKENETLVPVPFMDILREFDGKVVTFSIKEDITVENFEEE